MYLFSESQSSLLSINRNPEKEATGLIYYKYDINSCVAGNSFKIGANLENISIIALNFYNPVYKVYFKQ